MAAVALDALTVRPLGPDTWDAFADLAERHNGVWGGCWCTWFHTWSDERGQSAQANRAIKQRLVAAGRARAALVFDGDEAVAWCQYGSPAELTRLNHLPEVEAAQVRRPDWRITCFFVDRRYRRRGVSAVALRGALDLIARAGGGLVESYPQETFTPGKKVSGSLLYNATRTLFEDAGFAYVQHKGKNHCIVRLEVPAA